VVDAYGWGQCHHVRKVALEQEMDVLIHRGCEDRDNQGEKLFKILATLGCLLEMSQAWKKAPKLLICALSSIPSARANKRMSVNWPTWSRGRHATMQLWRVLRLRRTPALKIQRGAVKYGTVLPSSMI
jgi:uncharacterized protein HemY